MSIRYAPAYQRFEADQKLLAAIRQKAPIIFPAFTGISGAAVATEDEKGKTAYKSFLAVITCQTPLSEEEQLRLQKWLDSEAGMPVTFILKTPAAK